MRHLYSRSTKDCTAFCPWVIRILLRTEGAIWINNMDEQHVLRIVANALEIRITERLEISFFWGYPSTLDFVYIDLVVLVVRKSCSFTWYFHTFEVSGYSLPSFLLALFFLVGSLEMYHHVSAGRFYHVVIAFITFMVIAQCESFSCKAVQIGIYSNI